MSAGFLRILAGVFAFVAILLAFAGWRLGRDDTAEQIVYMPAPDERRDPSPYADGHPTVVALTDLSAGERINPDALAIVMYPTRLQNTYPAVESVPGELLSRSLPAGSLLTPSDFKIRHQLSHSIPEGHRGVAISVDELVGVGGHLLPGDRVDVLYSVASPTAGHSFGARKIFSGLTLLSVGARYAGEPSLAPEDDNARGQQRQASRTVVLEIEESLAPVLLLAENTGRLRLALLNPEEEPEETAALSVMQALATLANPQGEALPGLDSMESLESLQNVQSVESLESYLGPFFYLQDVVRDAELATAREQAERAAATREVFQHIGTQQNRVSLPVAP